MLKLSKVAIVLLLFVALSLKVYAYPKNCIIINIPSRTLALSQNGSIIKTYPVGVGRPTFPTPIGNFKVLRKLKKPGWENPYLPQGKSRINSGNNNPLGTRWIGFKTDSKGEYGIHGSYNIKSIGQFSSHGCVRMKVSDAEQLYGQVENGMPVIVTYNTFKLIFEGENVFLQCLPDIYKKGQSTIYTIKDYIQNLNQIIFWDALVVLNTIKCNSQQKVKIGTVIDEKIFAQ